jgi:hypothetical protein
MSERIEALAREIRRSIEAGQFELAEQLAAVLRGLLGQGARA